MNDQVIKKEIEQVELDLKREYVEKTDPLKLIGDLHAALLSVSQAAVDAANSTESYDEKITSLVTGLQECVHLVNAEKISLTSASIKYEHQAGVLKQLKTRIKDLDYVAEKKIEG